MTQHKILGGEPRVVEMLENKANQELREELLEKGGEEGENKKGSFRDFFCHPAILGKDMYTTVKFGLVQYVREQLKFVNKIFYSVQLLFFNKKRLINQSNNVSLSKM